MARVDLGLTEEEFWTHTYGSLASLIDRFQELEERADWRAALVTSMVANAHRDPKRKHEPYEPQDFMPTRHRGLETASPEKIRDTMRALFADRMVRKKK